MSAHDCPATGCTRRVAQHMLMCRPHWYMVPKPLRNDVWDAWQTGQTRDGRSHAQAITAAIEAVNAKLAGGS